MSQSQEAAPLSPVIVPYYESVGAKYGEHGSQTFDVYHTTRQLADSVLTRDWHLAQIEDRQRDRQRAAVGRESGTTAVEFLADFRDRWAAQSANRRVKQLEPALQARLDEYRETLGEWDDKQRDIADKFLRSSGLPEPLLAAASSSRLTNGNVIAWMQHKPTAQEPYGATDEQLRQITAWAAEHVAAGTKNPKIREKIAERLQQYQGQVQAAVAAGKLSRRWLGRKPAIKRFVVGDVLYPHDPAKMNAAYLHTFGVHEILFMPDINTESGRSELHLDDQTHEMTHAMNKGKGFVSRWLREVFTERFALLIDGADPTVTPTIFRPLLNSVTYMYAGANRPLTDEMTSDCYIGSDRHRNQDRLRKLVKWAYDGLDVIDMQDDLQMDLFKDGLDERATWDYMEIAMRTVAELNIHRRTGNIAALHAALDPYRETALHGDAKDALVAQAILRLFESDRRLASYERGVRHQQTPRPQTPAAVPGKVASGI